MNRVVCRLVAVVILVGLPMASFTLMPGRVVGATFGADVLVNDAAHASFAQNSPDMAIGASDNIFVAWVDYRNGISDIFVTKSVNGGASFGTDVAVDNSGTEQRNPALAIRGANNVYVVWQDYRNGNWDIYFSKSTDGGSSFRTPVKVSDAALASEQSFPDIAVAGNGDICVVWQDHRNSNWDIYSAVSTDNGDSFGANVRANSNPSPTVNQMYPSVAFNSENSVFVAWHDDRNGNWDIYMGRSTNNGASFQTEIRVNDGADNENQMFPDITVDGNDYVYVVWEDFRNGSNWDIYVSKSTNNGNSFGTNARVNDVTGGDQRRPSIFADADDNLHVAWHDARSANDYIYYSKSTDAGVSFGTGFRACDSAGAAILDGSPIVVTGGMNPGITWADSRSGNNDIFFTRGTNNAPTCAITSPAAGSVMSGTITIRGTASDPDGNAELTVVEVRIGSGAWETATGTIAWSHVLNTNSLSNGQHTIYARAYDGDLYSAIASVTMNVNNPTNSAPAVSIWSPNSGATLSGEEAVISGNATDPDGDTIFYVQIKIGNGNWVMATGTNNWAGWVYSLDTTTLSNGVHRIYARGYDGALYTDPPASVDVFVSNAGANTQPTVTILKPTQGQRMTGNFIVEGTASDPDGNLQVESVEVRLDNGDWVRAIPVAGDGNWTAWVYYINSEGLAAGEHTISARAYDGMDYSSEIAVSFTLAPGSGASNWLLFLLIVVIIALVVLILLLALKKKNKEEPVTYVPQPGQPYNATEPMPPETPPQYPDK